MMMQEYVTPYRRALNIISFRYSAFKIHFAIVLALTMLLAAIGAVTPYFLRETTNALSKPVATHAGMYVYLFACAYALSWTITSAMQWIKMIAAAFVMTRCDAAFYGQLFRHVIDLPFEQQKTIDRGAALADFQRSKSSFGMINQAVFWTLIPLLFELVLVFGMLWKVTDATFAAMFVSSMGMLFFIAYKIAQKSQSLYDRYFESVNNLSSFLSEKLGAFYEIKINHAQKREQEKLAPVLEHSTQTHFATHYKMTWMMGFQMASIGAALMAFTLYSVFSTLQGAFSVGDFVMVTSYTVQLTTPFLMVAGSLINIKRNYVELDSGLKYFDMGSPDRGKEAAVLLPDTVSYQIESVENSSGQWPGAGRFMIRRGKMYAVCGPSGAGKTSLLNAMLGLTPSDRYRILSHGRDIAEVGQKQIAKEVSAVPQEPLIFTASLRDNLLYGTDAAVSDDALIQLLKELDLKRVLDEADCPNPLDMEIGPHVRGLSGGEKQRIAIARALLRDKPIMMLDEPTSALDAATEEKVLRYLRSKVETLIVITHRPLAKALADEVIRFDGKTADATGSPEESKAGLSAA